MTTRNCFQLFFIALISWSSAEEPVRYDDYKVFKVFVDADGHHQSLKSVEKTLNLEFWQDIRWIGHDCDVMVSPEQTAAFEKFLQNTGIGYNLTINNVQKLIDAAKPKTRSAKFDWTSYHTLDEINAWVAKKAKRFPRQVKLFSIGKSFEGRDIKGMKISYKKGNKAIFIESAIHGCEWISTAVITYIIENLLESWNPKVRYIAKNLDWYIIPVLNPDGYVYSHEVNRLWRKNRQTRDPNCVGIDLNRNFDYLWMSAGASDDPCDVRYAGPYAQSEPEIDQLVKYVNRLPDNYIRMYISLHSYSQLVLSPWGHTEELPETYADMMHVAHGFADALAMRYGTNFTCGSSATTLYKVSGSGKEWAYGAKGIPIAYTIELRDRGTHGFVLPPEQILPSAKETLDGFVGMILAAKKIKII